MSNKTDVETVGADLTVDQAKVIIIGEVRDAHVGTTRGVRQEVITNKQKVITRKPEVITSGRVVAPDETGPARRGPVRALAHRPLAVVIVARGRRRGVVVLKVRRAGLRRASGRGIRTGRRVARMRIRS